MGATAVSQAFKQILRTGKAYSSIYVNTILSREYEKKHTSIRKSEIQNPNDKGVIILTSFISPIFEEVHITPGTPWYVKITHSFPKFISSSIGSEALAIVLILHCSFSRWIHYTCFRGVGILRGLYR